MWSLLPFKIRCLFSKEERLRLQASTRLVDALIRMNMIAFSKKKYYIIRLMKTKLSSQSINILGDKLISKIQKRRRRRALKNKKTPC